MTWTLRHYLPTLAGIGLLAADLKTDGLGNLLGTLRGQSPGPRVLLMAHRPFATSTPRTARSTRPRCRD